MIRPILVALSLVLMGCAPRGASPASPQDFALAAMAEADRLAERELWPGFDPRATPVAIYTGESTLLFRHPSPPQGFRELAGHERAWAYPGRHPAVTANTSADLGGVPTATILLDAGARSVRSAAGLLVHELFHVFQRDRHPGWTANEASLFTYPVDAVEPLALRRLETEALRRALGSDDAAAARCWAATALGLRGRRFSELPPEAAAYERGTELNEGLARYVEHRATAREGGGAVLPERGFPPADVRERGYRTGHAFALLLDRFRPDWRQALEQDPATSLDALLADAVGGDRSTGCGSGAAEFGAAELGATEFGAAERAEAVRIARRDVADLRAQRTDRLRAFEEGEGWRIVVSSPGAPLFPQGFDPLNVEVVGAGRVLHDRFLKLGNGAATIEVLDRAALTTAAGAHPLFNGVRSVTLTGLEEEPTITRVGDTTRIRAEGVEIELTGGEATRTGRTIEVLLEP